MDNACCVLRGAGKCGRLFGQRLTSRVEYSDGQGRKAHFHVRPRTLPEFFRRFIVAGVYQQFMEEKRVVGGLAMRRAVGGRKQQVLSLEWCARFSKT